MTDLYDPKMSKKDMVYEYIKLQGRCPTSRVIKFGMSIYYNSAERCARRLAEEGKIWRMNSTIKNSLFNYRNIKEDVWSIYEIDK